LLKLQPEDRRPIESLPSDDPARDLIAQILLLVPVSHWSFARFKGRGSPDQVLGSGEGAPDAQEFTQLQQEFALQRERAKRGPRIAASLRPFDEPYVSGITLIFADVQRQFGILSLLRNDVLGPFTSVEVYALTLALDAASDRLAGLPLAEPEIAPKSAPGAPMMHVLDRDLNVVLTWDGAQQKRKASVTALQTRLAERLPPIIEDSVRKLIADWTADPATQAAGVAHPVPFLTVRTQPMAGSAGLFVGVLLERAPGGRVFSRAARKFALSPRELQTLAFLLPGATLNEIAEAMHITSSTVQDHIKHMLEKTGSRNRAEMISKVLDQRNDDD
jgi:DNA-binding CsgD family transcriptional regulator